MTGIWKGTTALVTGGSRGLGAALAEALASRGVTLVLVARGAEALERIAGRLRAAGATVVTLPADLAHPDTPAWLLREVQSRGLVIDHFINNAGVGPQGRFHQLPAELQLPTIDVNIRAATELAARLLPGMLQRRRGGILTIASTAAWQGLQWLPVYSASKAYLLTWSEAVWVGLRGTGLRCCCCSPGPVDTGFFESNRFTLKPPAWLLQSPAVVARRALRAYERDDCHVIPYFPFRILAWSTRLVPRALAARLGAWYGEPAH
ncbi:MAG TPA: SDR family NAD(P)-dependent oxidoreductase [Gemmatimonadales bacterium]|nr:SDR family NAD(P)-dependent oxidoreductase [Gemmatimonadales bacterium]